MNRAFALMIFLALGLILVAGNRLAILDFNERRDRQS
jgi:hypothetical protein